MVAFVGDISIINKMALHYANKLLCSSSYCGKCNSCQYSLHGSNPDLITIGQEDSTDLIKIDDIRF